MKRRKVIEYSVPMYRYKSRSRNQNETQDLGEQTYHVVSIQS